jgi:hypothetical protein
LAGVAIAALAASTAAIHWRWQPLIRQSSATPMVTFVREWRPRMHHSLFLRWSSDQRRLISSDSAVLTTRRSTGTTTKDISSAHLNIIQAAASDRFIAAPADINDRSGTAFTVVDSSTGEPVFHEPDPEPGKAGMASAAVRLAMSADGSRLAVGYRLPRTGQPVTIYDAQSWRRIATIDGAGDPVLGTSTIALSPDGARVAYGRRAKLVIANASSGQLLLEISGWPNAIAFNAAGDLIAADMADDSNLPAVTSALRIYRVTDGKMVASHKAVDHPEWDPKGRFIAFSIDWNHIGLWNFHMPTAADTTIEVPPFTGPLAVSPDGNCLAAATGDVIALFRIGDEVPSHAMVCDGR